MRSSFQGLEVSKRSIQVAQKALDVTGHNLGNAKTEGYTRQRVDTNSLYLNANSYWQSKTSKLSLAAQGVSAFGVAQVRNEYIDKRFRDMSCYLAETSKKSEILREVQTTIDCIENTGLDEAMQTLTSALSKYATNSPDNSELASIVRNQAYNITTMLNNYSKDLDRLLENNIHELSASVDNTNDLISRIVSYNKAITGEYRATELGDIEGGDTVSQYGPLELIDARNLLVDELSYLGNIHVENNTDGTIKVFMGDTKIIDGSKFEQIIMKDYENFNSAVLKFTNGDSVNIKSGELKAYTDLVNGNGPYANSYQSSEYGIPYYKQALDAFAQGFSGLLNQINGVTETDSSRAMFGSINDVYDEQGNVLERGAINASTIRISDEWMKDATMIGCIQNAETGAWEYSPNLDGGHSNKLYLAINNSIRFGRADDFEGSLQEYVQFLTNRIGQGISFLDEQYDTTLNTVNNLLDARDAVSGVSDTEEGINMMTYQKWFNASSRVMTTMDECLDRIINNMGRVGL